jgi:hypothetical protein
MKRYTALQIIAIAVPCVLQICSAHTTNQLVALAAPQTSQATAFAVCESLSPTECWKQYQLCHPKYFLATRENMVKSNTTQWYPQFISDVAINNPGPFLNRGEAAIFGYEALNEFEFQCSIYHEGCTVKPSCEKTIQATEANNPDKPTPEVLDLARKAHFSMLLMYSLAEDYRYAYVRTLNPLRLTY